jgi:molecular chaperone HscC
MKAFRAAIARLFGRFPAVNIDPDLAIAMGATVQAGLLMKDGALDDVVLTDVAPYTLGMEVNSPDGSSGGHFMPIIERNSVVPISVERSVCTAQDNQTYIAAKIYQGEHRLVEKNVFLGSLDASVPRGPAGQEHIDVRYSYDMNGLLEVQLTVRSTGAVFSKVIEQTPGAISEAEKRQALARLAELKFHPRDQEENRALLARGERMYETSLAERREYIARILAEFDRALNRQQPLEITKARRRIEELLDQLDTEEWI